MKIFSKKKHTPRDRLLQAEHDIELYDYVGLQVSILRRAHLREATSTCIIHTSGSVERDPILGRLLWHDTASTLRRHTDTFKRRIIVDTLLRRHRRHFITQVYINMVFINNLSRKHTVAASITSSTRIDTRPLTVLLQDAHDTDDGIDHVRRLRLIDTPSSLL
jgi:hypothetical protein